MTPEEFAKERIKVLSTIKEMKEKLEEEEYKAHESPFPDNLRKATADDVVKGAIFYYKDRDPPYWNIIGEVYYPNDDFKAYCCTDGCNYGLYGAFVRV